MGKVYLEAAPRAGGPAQNFGHVMASKAFDILVQLRLQIMNTLESEHPTTSLPETFIPQSIADNTEINSSFPQSQAHTYTINPSGKYFYFYDTPSRQ